MGRLAWSTRLLIVLTATSCASGAERVAIPVTPVPVPASTSPPGTNTSPSGASARPVSPAATALPGTQTIATRLPVPWGLAFLPDGTGLVTLRDRGEVWRVSTSARPVLVSQITGVRHGGEGGLLGVAISPRFMSDRSVFLYLTSSIDNRVIRLSFVGRVFKEGRVIVKGIPRASNHNGGRLAFGPDGYLYISTGDAGQRTSSQNKASLGGKILRVTTSGAPAPGNPFPGSRVWSLGHRNVQGMAWDRAGRMFASEFGQNTWDELNRILPGRNYGWPLVEGIGHRSGFVDPIRQWATSVASPSGIAVGADGAIYMAALRGQSLWRIPLDSKGRAGTPQRLMEGRYGRLRAAVSAQDGRLWVVTNNTSRGNPKPGDDRIMAFRLPVQ